MDDVIVVGGSFAGISAALALARARRRVRVLDTGLPRNRFSAAAHNVFAMDGTPPIELLAKGRAQLEAYETVVFESARATTVATSSDGFTLTLENGETREARRLVLAYGVADQFPDLPGFLECWGKSVLHCPYCHGYEVAGRRWGTLIPVEAIAHAVPLYSDWTGDLTVFADGAELDAAARDAIARYNARLVAEPVIGIEQIDGQIRAVRTQRGTYEVDALFSPRQVLPATDLAEQLGCAHETMGPATFVRVDDKRQTSVAGVYAAGDLAHAMHSVSAAIGHGTAAGAFAHQSLLFQ
ncbi:NAD(P)/FAD-dependent oxidoreductase [Devosia nitrariae]|uniref:Thioredoxin reductase n=1 Tax=Devosia nitrariae TaxID=2071872 RepID=A0ABQ5VZG0_9HYPH|nr:NAD(P)/FAD-dependent oxidoreductase [Devosia nitrariae]GLQ52983.1 pyridine nucleotide-disulfide oxidoreductase [Devosia nitrariae]